MSNPNNSVGTNGAFGGRTSVNALNDVLSAFAGRGIISGWGCSPSSGLTVTLGGDGTNRDVAIAEDAAGNKTTVNNILQTPVAVTVNAAPASNARIDAIVAYIEDSPAGSGVTDNPDVVNLLVVSGTVASAPIIPNDSAIRTAITADGASGSTAYYVVLASVRIPTGTTDIDSSMISAGSSAGFVAELGSGVVTTDSIASGAVSAAKIDFTSLSGNYSTSEQNTGFTWIDGKTIYKKTISLGALPNNTDKDVAHGITGLDRIIHWEGIAKDSLDEQIPLPFVWLDNGGGFVAVYESSPTNIRVITGSDRSDYVGYITLYYTKSS